MRRSTPTSSVWKNMISYGAGLGTLFAVALGIVQLAEIYFGPPPEFMPFHAMIVLCGFSLYIMVGAVFGTVTGFVTGLAMWWITRAYGNPKDVIEYRISVGLSTAFVTTLLFLPLFFAIPSIRVDYARDNHIIVTLFLIVVAVYASQRVASQYLRENDVRKSKVK